MYHYPSHDEQETSVTSFVDLSLSKFILNRNDNDGIRTCTAEGEELVASQGAACRATCSFATPPPPLFALFVVLALALPALILWIVLIALPQVSLYAAGGFVRGIRGLSHVIRGPKRKKLVSTIL